MKTIDRFDLTDLVMEYIQEFGEEEIDFLFSVKLSEDAEVLSAQCQFDQAEMWVLEGLEQHKINRNFLIVETGRKIASKLKKYVGTFQFKQGMHEFHLFEIFEELKQPQEATK